MPASVERPILTSDATQSRADATVAEITSPLAFRHDDGARGSEKHLQAAFARSGCGAMTILFVKPGRNRRIRVTAARARRGRFTAPLRTLPAADGGSSP